MKLQRFGYGEALVFDTFIFQTQWSLQIKFYQTKKIFRIYLYLIVHNNMFITLVNISDNDKKQYIILNINKC